MKQKLFEDLLESVSSFSPKDNPHIGSRLDDFLRDEGLLEDCEKLAELAGERGKECLP